MTASVKLQAVSDADELQRLLTREGFVLGPGEIPPEGDPTCLLLVSELTADLAVRLTKATAARGGLALTQKQIPGIADGPLAVIGSPVILGSLVRSGVLPLPLADELEQLLEQTGPRPARLVGHRCILSLERPRIMGILNVTPDSFYAGSRQANLDEALREGVRLAAEGADLIDIGGESTRPGAKAVPVEDELQRVLPVIERLSREVDCPLSVDTNKSRVAAAAVAAGASFVNDISGLQFDPDMAQVVAESGAGIFLMHTRGRPWEMQQDTRYRNLLKEMIAYLGGAVDQALAAGIHRDRLAVDPGIGFGKSAEGNLQVLHRLSELHSLGCPLLLGTSRKNFIGRALGLEDPALRLAGTLATVSLGVAAGAHIFRVHDVGPARDAALMAWAICHEQMP